MNPSPLPKSVNSSNSHQALRAGQIPTSHDLLDFEQVESLTVRLEDSLTALEDRYADYVTNVSLKKPSRR